MSENESSVNNHPVLEVRSLKKYFPVKKGVFARVTGWIKAVDGVSFTINKGETFGLVGESGCGKSTTSKLILLIEPLTAGNILFEGKDISKFSSHERHIYRESIQPVLQDPTGSLDPRLRIRSIISEPMTARGNQHQRQDCRRVDRGLHRMSPPFCFRLFHR